MKKGIIFCLFMCFCAMQVFSFKGSVKLQFVGKFLKPKDVVIKGPTCVLSKDGSLFMLPYSRFATTQLYVFDFKKLEFKQLYQYPDEAKYFYIPLNDSVFETNFAKNPLTCYPCTFSFKGIITDNRNGNIYASVVTSRKVNDSSIASSALFFRLDTFKIFELNSDEIFLYGYAGKFIIIGDTVIIVGSINKGKIDEYSSLCFFNINSKKVTRKADLRQIEKELNVRLKGKGGWLYNYLGNNLIAIYLYSQTPPIIINLNNFNHSYLKYQGKLGSIKDGNFSYSTDNNGDTIRTFLLKFIPNDGKIVLVGGKNKGTLLDNFELQEIYLQYYNKDNLNLEKEFVLEFPTQKNYQFFDCFTDPNDKSKLYFLLYTKENDLDLYYTNIE